MRKERVYAYGKRILAWIMMLCMVMTNNSFTNIYVHAEEDNSHKDTTKKYTINATVKVSGDDISIPNSYITIKDQAGTTIPDGEDGYSLKAGTNYICVIEGDEMEEDQISFKTPDNAGEINISAKDSKIRLVYNNYDPDKFCVEDSITPVSDLKIKWNWSVSAKGIVSIDETTGRITASAGGDVIITRTSAGTPSQDDTKVTNTYSIHVTGEGQYRPVYTIKGTEEKIKLNNKNVIIKDSEGKTVNCDSKGQYTFVWGNTYTYELNTKIKGVSTPEDTSFVVTKNTKEVQLPFELTVPVMTLEDKELTNSLRIKKMDASDTAIITCNNTNDLYDTSKWQIQINNGELKGIKDNDITINTKSNVTIKFYYNNTDVKKDIVLSNFFNDYTYTFTYGGETIQEPITKTIVKKDSNKYEISDMQATGLTYDKNKKKTFTTKYTQEHYDIELKDNVKLKTPEISIQAPECKADKNNVYYILYGSTVTVKVSNMSELLNDGKNGWSWKWDKDVQLDNATIADDGSYTFDLKGEKDQIYTLTYYYKDNKAVSNTIKLKVTKVQLKLNEKKELPVTISKVYDTTKEFQFSIALDKKLADDTQCFTINQDLGDKSKNIKIELTGEVTSEDVGTYKKIKITNAVAKEGNKDVLYIITSSLIGQECDITSAEITKATADFEFEKFALYYKNQTIDKENTTVIETSNKKIYTLELIEKTIKDTILDHMGRFNLKKGEDGKFSETECDFPADGFKISNENVDWTIQHNGQCKMGPQVVKIEDNMNQKIEFYKKDSDDEDIVPYSVGNNQWINCKGNITARFTGNESTNDFIAYYDTIRFEKTSYENGTVEVGIKHNAQDSLKLKKSNKDQYYKVTISSYREEEHKYKYETTALILHIVAEENPDKDYPDKIMGDNGTEYYMINLKMDAGGDQIKLSLHEDRSDAIMGIDNSQDGTLHSNKYNKETEYQKSSGSNLYLSISDTLSPVQEMYYHITPVGDGDIQDTDLVMNDESSGWWKAVKEDMTIPLEGEEGKYIVLVKVVDSIGNVSLFASNKIILDNTSPEITASLGNTSLNKGEVTIVNALQKLQITVTEGNLDQVEVSVTAKDRSNQMVMTNINANDIKNVLLEDKQTTKHEYSKYINADANYTIDLKATDLAGNETSCIYKFTIDTMAPDQGKIQIKGFFNEITNKNKGIVKTTRKTVEHIWNVLAEKVYDVFLQDSVDVSMTASDVTTDVDIYYIMADHAYTEEELRKLNDNDWMPYDDSNKPKTKADQREFVYMRATDKAGNSSFFNSKGIITDAVAPEIHYALDRGANKNGFYNDDVVIQADVEDATGSLQNGSSGLRYVGYRIEVDNKNVKTSALIDDVTAETYKSFKITLDAKTYNSNNIKVYMTAVDNAGNMTSLETKPIRIKLDSVAPQIQVTFDDTDDGEYHNHNRTATVAIMERNLKTEDVDIHLSSKHGSKAVIGNWSHTDNIEKSDNAVYTCKVQFDKDDDYELYVDCEDKAGNKAKTSPKYKFTIDKTVPTIEVSYNNVQITEDSYFNQEVTATVTIKEHNFDVSQAKVQASSQDGAASSTSTFSGLGDIHTANITFNQDGVYQLQVAFRDKAGNEAEMYKGKSFTIDLTDPEIQIANVEDKSANRGDVQPVIICKDNNYDSNNVTITVTGSNKGDVDLSQLEMSRKATGDGEEFSMNFPEQENMDDVYTLTARMEDKAGNDAEQSVQFSVNRYGSVYTLETKQTDWLVGGVCSYVKKAHPIVIVETNVDEVVTHNISYTTGAISAETVAVKDQTQCTNEEKESGTYYVTKDVSAGNKWYQYEYMIAPENFSKEGNYSIQIDSTDKAGNHASNVSNKHKNSNLEILFAVDQTAPSAVISGTENGGIYKEAEHTVLVDVQDNIALKDVTIYLNGNEYVTYDAGQIAELEDGMIPVNVSEAIATQKIQLVATDMAGNILGESPEGEFDKTFEDFNLLVTRNVLVQILYRYWFVLIIGVVAIAGGIIVILIKKRKKNK